MHVTALGSFLSHTRLFPLIHLKIRSHIGYFRIDIGELIMKLKRTLIYLPFIVLILLYGCRTNNSNSNKSYVTAPDIDEEQQTVIITDITGREWDITNAVAKYDMKARYFHFGIGIGAIPSVDNPTIISQDSPDFPDPDRAIEVFGTDINEDQRAYAKYELARHEIFNDDYPNSNYGKVAVGYCPLFNLAAVYSRRLDGITLTFAPSGWTYGENTGNSLFVLIDKQTLSLWFPMKIKGNSGLYCIAGKYADKFLPEVQQLQRASWKIWLEANPNTKFVTEE
jgi:hypothetical protein